MTTENKIKYLKREGYIIIDALLKLSAVQTLHVYDLYDVVKATFITISLYSIKRLLVKYSKSLNFYLNMYKNRYINLTLKELQYDTYSRFY